MPARGSDGPSTSLACNAKMAPRISLIVWSMSSTARVTRSATSGLPIIGMVPCRDIPVAYSRWMTRSCRSRAIRSLSWYTERRSASARLAASSSATPACAAKAAANAASACGNGSLPCRRPMVSTPRRLSGAPSGNTTAGPMWLIAARAEAAARSSPAKSTLVDGVTGGQHLSGQRLPDREDHSTDGVRALSVGVGDRQAPPLPIGQREYR